MVVSDGVVYDIGFYIFVIYLTRLCKDKVKIGRFKPDFTNHAKFIRSASTGSPLVNLYTEYVLEILPSEEICLAAGYGTYSNYFYCSTKDIAVDTCEELHKVVAYLLQKI